MIFKTENIICNRSWSWGWRGWSWSRSEIQNRICSRSKSWGWRGSRDYRKSWSCSRSKIK